MANLLIVRHAIALEREEWNLRGRSDFDRPLSERGERKFKKALAGLKKIILKIDTVYSSELVRARETAEILSESYGLKTTIDVSYNHGKLPRDMLTHLSKLLAGKNDQTIAVVGHEPELCVIIHLITGLSFEDAYLKKGGMAYISNFPEAPKLQWLKRPKELRALGFS